MNFLTKGIQRIKDQRNKGTAELFLSSSNAQWNEKAWHSVLLYKEMKRQNFLLTSKIYGILTTMREKPLSHTIKNKRLLPSVQSKQRTSIKRSLLTAG